MSIKMTPGSDALGFQEQCLLLQLLVGGQDHAYSFRNARKREDAAESLQRLVHSEVFFEATFHRPSPSCDFDFVSLLNLWGHHKKLTSTLYVVFNDIGAVSVIFNMLMQIVHTHS
jgi:hypothetical protein